MNFLAQIFTNKYILVPAAAWLAAQILKLVLTLIKYKKLDFTRLVGTGGMPSSHTAYVVSLCSVVGINIGFDTVVFGITFAFACVVMSDAAGVRRAAGKQAKILNALMSTHFSSETFNEKLKELIGHQPLEVLVGAALGLLFGVFM